MTNPSFLSLGGRAVGLALALALLPAGAMAAKEKTRCALLGPLVVSSYLALFQQVGAGQSAEAARQAASTGDLMALYERLGCPVPALTEALECVSQSLVDPKARQLVTERARACMEKAGMAIR